MRAQENITYQVLLREIEAHPHRFGLLAQGLALIHPGLPNYKKAVHSSSERPFLIETMAEQLNLPQGLVKLFDDIFSIKNLLTAKEKAAIFNSPQVLLGPRANSFIDFLNKVETGKINMPDEETVDSLNRQVNFAAKMTVSTQRPTLEEQFESTMAHTPAYTEFSITKRGGDSKAIQGLLRETILDAVNYSVIHRKGDFKLGDSSTSLNTATVAGLAGMEILSGIENPIFRPLFKSQFALPPLPPPIRP